MKEDNKPIITFPEVWDELSEPDWAAMLKLRERLLTAPVEGAHIDDVRNEAARCLLLHRGLRTRTRDDKYFLLVHQCAQRLDWLWQESEPGVVSLVYRSTVNLLPKWGQLYGPLSHGADMEFGELKEALALCQLYDRQPDHALLQQLAGLLYRRRSGSKKRWPRRIPYDSDGPQQQLARGQRMPRWFLWGVYAWFSFFCEYLTTGTFIIDGREVCFSPVFGHAGSTASASSPDGGLGLNAIAMTLAESGVFGSFDDVLHTSLMRVMLKLLHDKENFDRQTKQIKSVKP